jgi:hypothetical protein
MADLTEKNLENVFLNLTKTDKPITIKPTTWFGNPAKTAQWYTCPNCSKQSPLTLEWVGLTEEEVERYWDWEDFQTGAGRSTIFEMVRDIEAKLKEKNNA